MKIGITNGTNKNGNLPFEVIVDVGVQEPLYDVRKG